jgi:16S rRNA processing protein RimM
MNERRIPLGVLLKPHGLRGALRVHLHDPSSETLRKGLACDLERDGQIVRSLSVGEVRGAGTSKSVQFAGVSSIEDAEKLRGLTIVVRRTDLPVLEEGEFYVEDVIDAEVFERDASGALVARGKVTAFERYPSTDVFTVALATSGEGEGGAGVTVEVPLLERFVEAVDASVPRVVLHAGAIEAVTP